MIQKLRVALGFGYRRLRRDPHLTDIQKLNRLNWCIMHRKTDFSKYVFVDETSISLKEMPLSHWRLKSKYPRGVEMPQKYREKVNVWGGISSKGLTRFCVSFNGKLII